MSLRVGPDEASQSYHVLWSDGGRGMGRGRPSHFGVGRAGREEHAKVTQDGAYRRERTCILMAFPAGRFLMAAATWVFLLLHINLVSRRRRDGLGTGGAPPLLGRVRGSSGERSCGGERAGGGAATLLVERVSHA